MGSEDDERGKNRKWATRGKEYLGNGYTCHQESGRNVGEIHRRMNRFLAKDGVGGKKKFWVKLKVKAF